MKRVGIVYLAYILKHPNDCLEISDMEHRQRESDVSEMSIAVL